jgi:hypothetical protein
MQIGIDPGFTEGFTYEEHIGPAVLDDQDLRAFPGSRIRPVERT